MGTPIHQARPGRGSALTTTAEPAATRGISSRIPVDALVFDALVIVLILAAATRRDFLGDGVRHLTAVLSDHFQLGEPRWLLFPVLARFWVRLLTAVGVVHGAGSALRAILAICVAAGILFLYSLRSWLQVESADSARRAASLLLAGSCAPFLLLFSDIAEPQVAAGLAAVGLAHARVRRDDPGRAETAVISAIAAIAMAALIYQGVILSLGMLPLVARRKTLTTRRVLIAAGAALLAAAAVLIGAQIATGTSPAAAVETAVGGERNPLTRSFMAAPSPVKYAVALVAGPPQGIIALEHFAGVRALLSSLHGDDPRETASAVANVGLLVLGCAVTGILLTRAIRDRQWQVLAAAAILLVLPVLRNQQYAYVKFYVLWPIPVAVLAVRCRTRTMIAAGSVVFLVNGWLLANEIQRGRQQYVAVQRTYADASASTCWLTSGWAPPLSYLWPGKSAPILGTLATGTQPADQASALSAALQRCFCESDAVWTDTTKRDAELVASVARHFEFRSFDLGSILVDPADAHALPMAGVYAYSDAARARGCHALGR